MVSKSKKSVFEDKSYFVLFTAGPCGSLLLHSLLDSHPEVLTIPTYFDYYAFYDRNRKKSVNSLVKHLMDSDPASFVFKKRNTPAEGNFTRLSLDLHVFRESVVSYLGERELTSRSFIDAIHYGYAKGMKQDLKRVKAIFIHNHYSDPIPRFREDFPGVRFVLTVRNPKAILYSYQARILKLCGGYIPAHMMWTMIRSIQLVWQRHCEWLGTDSNKQMLVRLEDMHKDLGGVAERVADWMEIEKCEELYDSTLGGNEYICTTASNSNLTGGSGNVTEMRYKKELPSQFEEFAETLFEDLMLRCSYEFIAGRKMRVSELAKYRFENEKCLNPFKAFLDLYRSLSFIKTTGMKYRWFRVIERLRGVKVVQFCLTVKGYPEYLRLLRVRFFYLGLRSGRIALIKKMFTHNVSTTDKLEKMQIRMDG